MAVKGEYSGRKENKGATVLEKGRLEMCVLSGGASYGPLVAGEFPFVRALIHSP